MKNTQHHSLASKVPSSNKFPTIGVIIANVYRQWEIPQWKGIADAAHQHGINLICFPGRELRNSWRPLDAQANIIYDLINIDLLDGLILWAGGFDSYVNRAEAEDFCKRYCRLPLVIIERLFDGIPSVLMDDYRAMREILIHLIEIHGYRRIAFIRGRISHPGFQERYRAYTETLTEYGLPLDPNLITDPSESESDERIAAWLQDERRTDIDAIAGFSDEGILRALRALQSLGRRVPQEVTLTGFDDIKESQASMPPLTTTRQPFYEMGQRAVELVLAILAGESVPERSVLPSRLIVRQSCGCQDSVVAQARAGVVTRDDADLALSLPAQHGTLVAEMLAAVGTSAKHAHAWAIRIVETFTAEVESGVPGTFLSAIQEIVQQMISNGEEAEPWQNALSVLRRQILPRLHDRRRDVAEDLWQQARVVIGQAARQMKEAQQVAIEKSAQILQEIGARLISTFDVPGLLDILVEELPRLDIPGCWLALYEEPQSYAYPQPAPEWSRLVLDYRKDRRCDLGPQGQRFRSHQLIPYNNLFEGRHSLLIVEPLYFRDQQIGFAVFETGPQNGNIYEMLRTQISSALQGALLVQRVQDHALELASAYEEIRILNDQLKEENLRMSAELDVSRRIQQMVLPSPEELQHIEGLEIVGFMKPATEVGGDYYDVLKEGGTIHIGIGDVTGHGLESGVLMLMTQTAIRTLIEHGETDPVIFLETLNRTVYKNLQRMKVDKTLTLAFVNYQNGQLKLIGQHEELLVVRRGGQVERVDTINLGFPLGLEEHIATFVKEQTISLQAGESVVLYTDGITEAENDTGELYGIERLCEVISRHWDQSAEAIKQAIIHDVTRYIGRQKVYDDLTLVILKQK